MSWLANLVYLGAGLAYLPVAVYNALLLGKNRRGWAQRFGGVPRFDHDPHCGTGLQPVRRIWIHAVSLGEINATPRLVDGLHEALPDCDVVFSTTTDTGYARAVQLYGADRVFRFPLDFSWVVNRTLRRINPSLIVLVELAVWYNLVRLARRRGIPVAVVNGRLTAHSAKRLSMFGALLRPMFADLAWVAAQDWDIAERFRALGVPDDRIQITSSMKWDTAQITEAIDGADELREALSIDASRPLWVCGSTGPGEEPIILQAYRRLCDDGRRLRLAIVPRKPERFDEVFGLIRSAGFQCLRRSDAEPQASACADAPRGLKPRGSSEVGPHPEAVILGDTMGELRKFYSLADVVFVGRSLTPMGGSDPIEVAALGKAIVVGPCMDNFQTPVDALRNADAVRIVHDAVALADAVAGILSDPEQAALMGLRAREVVIRHKGTTRGTVEGLVALLDMERGSRK